MITIPIEIGDVILTGKFKNRRVTVQEIRIDEYGLPTVNGKGIMRIRVEKLMPQKKQEQFMRKINEAPTGKDPKIQMLVASINELINSAKDSDGDPIEVIDSSGTWEEPMVYDPIVYQNNGSLKISYSEPRRGSGKNVDFIKKSNMEFDGIPTLKNIAKMYKAAIKKAGKPTNENKVTSKMKLSEVISKGVFINIKKEDGKFWFYIDTVDGPECISNVGFPTKEAAEHAALTKGFNVEKGGDAEDEMPETVEVPKPTKREVTKKTEKPKEIDLGKAKEIKEHVIRIIREEIERVYQKKKSLTEEVKITKKIELALSELKELQDILAKANAEIEAIKKKFDMGSVQKKADELLKVQLWDFLEELKRDETRIVKLKGIILKINRHQASPATYEYEKVLDFVMTQVNQEVKAKILAELKIHEKIGQTKANVSFTTEAVGDVWNSIVNFLTGIIPALKRKGSKIDNDIAKAEAQLANIA